MSFITSPNMGLIIPTVLGELGPQYAEDVNGSLSTVDSHNHSPGSGVPITPAGLNISSDLTFQSNNQTNVRSTRFSLFPTMGDFNPSASDINCALDVGGDLYFIDGSGNQIQITKSGFVNSGSGSISGLSGFPNASASYNGLTGTFVWEQGINQAANMDSATLIIRYPGSYPTPTGNYIALQAPAALSTGYALTFPLTLPSFNDSWMVSTTSGSESWISADNSTVQVTGGFLQVVPGGITATQLGANSVTTPKIQNGAVTAPKTNFNIDLAATIFTTGGTFLVPTNVTNIAVLGAGGGGGAGGGNSGSPNNRGGGGGGAGAQPLLTTVGVVSGETLTIVIGSGGSGGAVNGGNGGTGGSSTITGSSSGLILTFYGANGGGGGFASTDPNGGSGPGTSSFNASGGNGALNADPMASDGVSSIYASSSGTHGTGGDSGGGGGAGFGIGGMGGNSGVTGNPGGISAGGGGGGGTNVSGGLAGGAGGGGIVIIYSPTPV